MKKNDTTCTDDALILSVRLAAKFPLSRCWAEGQQIYIRYATGFSEYLTISEARKMLG